jgi:predicted thioesterase
MDFSSLIKPGIGAQKTDTVTDDKTASVWGSGGLSVYATPAMIALMEEAALSAVDTLLPPDWSTVGTELNVKHIAATPMGMKVYAKAELLGIDGRALSFKVEAFDETGKIGEGVHSRCIVDNEKSMAKIEVKKIKR